MFKFTFNFGSAATVNPFTAQAEERDRIQQAVAPQTIKRKLPAPPRRPSPPPSIAEGAPRTRKRGWVPTTSLASEAISQPALTNGWIDTPAKYLSQASQSHGGEEEEDIDLPPAKKRKTFTDSIISTAFSAALIGTAVGMTAYRMWRDRGKSSEEPQSAHIDAPPPYQREEWVDDMPRIQPATNTPRSHKKTRPPARRAPRHRRAPIAISPARTPTRVVSPPSSLSRQDRSVDDHQDELEVQMDWMGDKIRHLIEEGQKALGKEIVIKTDEQKDEEEGATDDGMEGWEEENHGFDRAGPSSPQRRTIKPLTINTSMSTSSPHGAISTSYSSASTVSRSKRSRYTASNSHSGTSPQLVSPYLGVPNRNRLGGRSPNEEDFKVIYEPGASASELHSGEGPINEDEDSRRLIHGMDAIRKAYNIH